MNEQPSVTQNVWAAEPMRLKIYLETRQNATAEQIEAARSQGSKGQKPADIFTIMDGEAIVEISGMLTPDGPDALDRLLGLGGTGFKQLQAAFKEIAAMDDVKTVRLLIDSPGGTVAMTDETYQVLRDLAMGKSVIAYNYGMIASAAYWLAVAADSIEAISPTVATGSIGVRFVGYDFSKMLEDWGIKQVILLSQNAPSKGKTVADAKTVAAIQEYINAIERVFIARVAAGRNTSEKKVRAEYGQGSILIAQDPGKAKPDAVSVGMIDRVAASTMDNQATNDTLKSKPNSTGDGGKTIMKLTEVLADHPDARAEHERMLSDQFKAGQTAGQEAIESRIKAATPFLSSTDYPGPIRELAVKVISGDVEASALTAAVSAFDAVKETAASDQAADDSAAGGDTPPVAVNDVATDDGTVSNLDDARAEAKRLAGTSSSDKGGN